jgi:integrase/recombinase XerD
VTAVLQLVPPASAEVDWSRWLGQFAPNTQEAFRRDFEQWVVFLDGDLHAARVGDVNAWIGHLRDDLGRASSTVARKVTSVASYYSWAAEEGLTDCWPIPKRRPKRHPGPVKLGIDRDQALAVLAAARGYGRGGYALRAHALMSMLVFCGLRVSEAVGLDLSLFGEQRGHRVVDVTGKGGKVRTVPVPPPAWVPIETYLAGRTAGPVFVTDTGRAWDRHGAYKTAERVGRLAGVPLHPHLMRHTAITLALDAGAPVDRVQTWAGHASLDTTMGYARARQQLDASPGYDVARWLAEDNPQPTG